MVDDHGALWKSMFSKLCLISNHCDSMFVAKGNVYDSRGNVQCGNTNVQWLMIIVFCEIDVLHAAFNVESLRSNVGRKSHR